MTLKVPFESMGRPESGGSGEKLRLGPLIDALDASGARYAVIGGVALSLYVEDHCPEDLDVVFAPGRRSGRRAHAALDQLVQRCPTERTQFVPPPRALARGGEVRLETSAGVLDVVGTSLPSSVSRRGIVRRAVRQPVLGLLVPVCHFDDLLRIKSGTRRDVDRDHAEALRRVRT